MASKVSGSDMRFLETGTLMKGNIYKQLMKSLLAENKEQYQMLSQREKDKEPTVKSFVKDLRSRIFEEKFTLYREREGKNIELLKKELEGMFGRYKDLQNSDFVILNTFFNDYDPGELDMDKVLFKVTNKLADIADQNLQGSKNVGETLPTESIAERHPGEFIETQNLDEDFEESFNREFSQRNK